jgi:tRNA(His) guanylyltransferase
MTEIKHHANIIGDIIKAKECIYENMLPKDKPFVIRLDGHGFSKFTSGFTKPCDKRITNAMISTAGDLLNEFSARCAFVESDEITLVFPAISNTLSNHIYNGRVQKLCSLTAGFASTKFNKYLKDCVLPVGKQYMAYFDSRVFSVTDDNMAKDAVFWRYKYDTFRNGISTLAQTIYSAKEVNKKSTGDKISMLKDANVMLVDQDPHLLYGTFIKKKLVEVMRYDHKTKQNVSVTRCMIHSDQVKLSDMTPDKQTEFIMRKYW